MIKKDICIIAQFPPPMHGLSKAVQTLYDSQLKEKYHFTRIDITNNKAFLRTTWKLLHENSDLFYLTVAQSRFGNLRDLMLMLIIILRKRKFGIHVHGGLYYREVIEHKMPRWQRNLNYKLLSKADYAISLSDSLRQNFIGILPKEKIFVIENGVDKEFIPSKKELQKALRTRAQDSVIHVLYLSNFLKTKGYQIVLEMAKQEKDRISSGKPQRFVFDFAGKFFDQAEHQFFSEFVAEHQLDSVIVYHGVVSGDQKKSLLLSSSIFCLPTTYPIEGQPISILEAMANGQYIISTRFAGIPDMVDPVGGALLDPHQLPRQYYTILRTLTTQDFQEAGLHNYQVIMTKYSETGYLLRFDKLFELITQKL
jgi:glycosyltransferase involved in cell wall biosynthesis